MQQRRRDLGAHALAERELAHRLIEQPLEPEHRHQLVARPAIVALIDTVDVAQQIEAVDDRQIPPELRALTEHDADPRDVPQPIFVRNEPADHDSAAVGRRIPERILMVVDLPAPFGPMKPSSSPASSQNETSTSASTIRCRRRISPFTAPRMPGSRSATR